jgi:hypothetical protein
VGYVGTAAWFFDAAGFGAALLAPAGLPGFLAVEAASCLAPRVCSTVAFVTSWCPTVRDSRAFSEVCQDMPTQ